MRMIVLLPGLSLLWACTPAPTEVTTDSSPTGSSTAGTMSADSTAGNTMATTGPVCPPVPPDAGDYDSCPGLCGGGGQCLYEMGEYAVCTRGCFMDCDCWASPGGDAPARCNDQLLENTSLCVLDCSGGQSCPGDMFCVTDLGICAHEYPQGAESTDGSSSGDSGTTDMGTSTGTGTTDTGTGSSTSDMSSSGSSTGDMSSSGSSTGDMSSSGSSTGDLSSSGSSTGDLSSSGSSTGGMSSTT